MTGFKPRSALTLISSEPNVYFSSCASSLVLVQFDIKIKFHAAYGPDPVPYKSLSSPPPPPLWTRASVWVCLRLIALTSGITPSHSAVPTGSPQKEKKHTLHTPQKKKIDFTRTPQNEKTLYLPPNSSRCAKQSKVPLVSPPPSLSFFFSCTL